jgi:hypothetical protein
MFGSETLERGMDSVVIPLRRCLESEPEARGR